MKAIANKHSDQSVFVIVYLCFEFYSNSQFQCKHMDNGIKALIEKERDAKEQIEKAILYKEEMRTKSSDDANIAIGMIIEDQNLIIAQKIEESKEYLNKYKQEKDKEFEKVKLALEKKNFSKLIEKLTNIVTGKDMSNFEN